jgi:hypothetical protein
VRREKSKSGQVASLALIVALRERVEQITSGKAVLDDAEPSGATVTQDEL